MEPDNSPRKIQFTVPLLEPHLDPEAAEQVWAGRGSGTQRRTRDRVTEPESLPSPPAWPRTPPGMHSPSLWGVSNPSPNGGATSPSQCGSLCGVSPRASFLPALPWGHDPSPSGDLASPHSQSTPGVSRLGVGTDRERAQGGGRQV